MNFENIFVIGDAGNFPTSKAGSVSLRLGGNVRPAEIGWTGALVRPDSSSGSAAVAAGMAGIAAFPASASGCMVAVVLAT